MTLPARFWSKVDKNGPIPADRPELGPCWIWTAGKRSNGYGTWWLNGRMVSTHRSAFEDAKGRIPDGLEPDHLCRVRECCNPAHLEAVTRAVNTKRGLGPAINAAIQRAKTHCPKGHAYDDANTYPVTTVSGGDGRGCKECRRENVRRYRAREREKANECG